MSVQISDCTIRDGGYLTNKEFSVPFITHVLEGLVDAGIDYIETGFFQSQSGGEPIVYQNSTGVLPYLPKEKKNSTFVGFCDNSRYQPHLLDASSHVESFRVSFAKHEWEDALVFCKEVKEKGYRVFVQPMDAVGYSKEEREALIKQVNLLMPEAFSIVDTFGIMQLKDLKEIFAQVDGCLDRKIKIGIHTHNNLQLANALVEYILLLAEDTQRDLVVDGSLFGMGRGAGNACTELIAQLLNKQTNACYDVPKLLDLIEEYILPLRQTVNWGYDLPMFLCGGEESHTDNVYYLQKNTSFHISQQYKILHSMTVDEKKRYGANYSKSDFTALERAIEQFQEREQQT